MTIFCRSRVGWWLCVSRMISPSIYCNLKERLQESSVGIFRIYSFRRSSILTVELKKDIEYRWQKEVVSSSGDENETLSSQDKFYVLSMFPYPSGRLHMGHVRVYTISDAMARFYRMRGKKVIHPIGWDAFGLPAENAAIDGGKQPDDWTYSNIRTMKEQLKQLGISFDWTRELSTCNPDYYKWTQYIFLLMYHRGLAYRKEALVNWDPIDKTVLADEQVDEQGLSWRSGAKVEKKLLRQWFLRTTVFSKDLYDGLEDPMLTNWRDIVSLQRHWIGECTGSTVKMKVLCDGKEVDDTLLVWTDKPELIWGSSYIIVSPDHQLNQPKFYNSSSSSSTVGTTEDLSKGVLLRVMAVNPLSGQNIPIFVSSSFECSHATESHLGIPGEIETDLEFSQNHHLKVVHVTEKSQDGETVLINSGKFSGLTLQRAREEIVKELKKLKISGNQTSKKLRDWLISRQRYWGTPIPIVHCPSCKVVPVPLDDLPVMLPKVSTLSGRGISPLHSVDSWINTKCPKCGGNAQRETDTMDTFVDSSWYYLRFLDPHNNTVPFDTEKINSLMPVDLYIGGKEHAVMHLYYARFVSHFLHFEGLMKCREPFQRMLVQGMVMGQTFRVKGTGQYVSPADVEYKGKKILDRKSGQPVAAEWEKMSKSKLNGVDPEFPDILKWQQRLWSTVQTFRKFREVQRKIHLSEEEWKKHEEYLLDSRNFYLKGVTFNFQDSYQLSVAISKLQGLTGSLRRVPAAMIYSAEYEKALATLIILLSPLAPHFASELWKDFREYASQDVGDYDLDKNVLEQKWPEVDMSYCLDLVIKVGFQRTELCKSQLI
ncbi:probable leucine--tRNA ligase, mitochondrial [Limulus polyphemus]|uniref:leucine--tRNA ligase n=1 Tax=Limulus polyphemus TaxID=6850 RepID=A0ABM1BV55_LIMPO|nr:probable leucine--tRNA ligase, mitochondrial [Limulus polyphemus]